MGGAVLLRLLAPDAEERPDDAVRAPVAGSEVVLQGRARGAESPVKGRGLLRSEAVTRVCTSMQTGEFLFVKQAISLMMLEL